MKTLALEVDEQQLDNLGQRCEPLKINGYIWQPIEGIKYPHNYHQVVDWILLGEWDERSAYRWLIQNDLFFILYFIMGMSNANHPFVVETVKEIMACKERMTLEVYAREHMKSSIFSCAEPVQRLLNNPNERIAIFSHTRAVAKAFLRQIKALLETSDLLKACFPDILYQKPESEAFKWAEDEGLWLNRTSQAKEASLEAWGLIEGMPTSKHFTHRVYDDIETLDLSVNPDQMEKMKEAFDMSENLGSDGDTQRVIGTYYDHNGVLMYIKNKTWPDGRRMYTYRVKPATHDGTPTGNPVFLSQEKLDKLRSNPRAFYAQQLCDPTPHGTAKLHYSNIKLITEDKLPAKMFKFMAIDPAGVRKSDNKRGDSWAVAIVGVEPIRDEIGASNLFILDLMIDTLDEIDSLNAIVDLYCKHGRIQKIGIEKVAQSTAEIHVANALRARGRMVSIENGNLAILTPAGRKKEWRIEQALIWPLNNGKIHMLDSIPYKFRDRLHEEMNRFPAWHDDGLDSLAYIYDMIKDYRFPATSSRQGEQVRKSNGYDYRRSQQRIKLGWLVA